MTKEQAYEKLELAVGADLQEVRKQFARLQNDFQDRINSAPSAGQKAAFLRGLEELKTAYALLEERGSHFMSCSEQSFDDSSSDSDLSIEDTAQSLTLDEAMALFGVNSIQSAMEIETAIQKRMSSLEEQYGRNGSEINKTIHGEVSRTKEAQCLLRNWIAEKKTAEPSGSQPDQAVPTASSPPPKKNESWLYLIPVLLIVAGVIYFSNRNAHKTMSANNHKRTAVQPAKRQQAESEAKEAQPLRMEASYPGGIAAWREYLGSHLRFQVPADNGAPPGIYAVVVSFLVGKDGSISEVQVESAPEPDYGTAAEAVRVIEGSGQWNPAVENGRPVFYRERQRIAFRVAK